MKTGLIIFMVLASCGLVLGIAGVFVLAGLGYALLSAGAALLAAAGFIRKGLISG
ncbi:hypothetical protein [Pseudomonas fulva]|uniref:hypothetical protein n=1 Tax=Pseudomonas fulva TaxID=47880 RepID=UPI0015E4020F|nr:hypothetical protein [Pseudomonas fulva]MBA1217264.1 hypothetical protein [Pseudomonas fulva]MDH0571036.1 hypothetical protein [Pseudomonas fulva]